MSKDLGSSLPDDLFDFLAGSEPSSKFHQVILISTVDAAGWPRLAMLSSWEVVAKDPRRLLMLLYKTSRTTENLRRSAKVSLAIVNPDMSHYVICSARPLPGLKEAACEALFDLKVERVLEDTIPTAQIVTALTFDDPGMMRESREQVFRQLLEI